MEGLSGSGSAAGAAWVLGLRAEGWRKGEVTDSDECCCDEHERQPAASHRPRFR